MQKGKTLALVLIASVLLGIAMIGSAAAPDTTIGVEPASILNPALGPASTFTVEIWIRDVAELVGYEFQLGYDTAVLTATAITYGGIFGSTYMPIISVVNDAEGWVGYACMEMLGEPGFTGDGRAATVTFTVDSVGESALDIYYSELGDGDIPPNHLPHTRADGYFSNVPYNMASLHAKLVNVKKRHIDVCTYQAIKGLITNKGDEGTYVRTQFMILDAGHTVVDVVTSSELWVGPDADVWVTAEWHAGEAGSYYVKGVLEFSANGIDWAHYGPYTELLGGLESFRVVGPSWFKVA